MKKIVASVGLVALGTSGLQADPIAGTSIDTAKNWSVSATLRGFYDDNINTVHDNETSAFGFEVNPALRYMLRWQEQSFISASYQYAFKYYDHKPFGNSEKYDQTHTFDVALGHAFTEQYRISVQDSFAIGQEPDLLRAGDAFSSFSRISGDNIRNYGTINLDGQITRELGFQLGYANTFFDYHDKGFDPDLPRASNSGLLDRIEHTIHLDARWLLQPQTTGLVGYQFRDVSYTGDEQIGTTDGGSLEVFSKDRNFYQHYMYVGADHTFSRELSGTIRLGGRYIDYYNDNRGVGNGWGPYALINVQYNYAPQSFVEAGFSYDVNATDAFNPDEPGKSFTQNADSAVTHASLTHLITPKLFGSVIGSFQYSTFNGGTLNNEAEKYFLLGLNLKYHFTPHFSAEAGYNYDLVKSEVTIRAYDRNRVYLGVTAAY
jgi:hypothetical protein